MKAYRMIAWILGILLCATLFAACNKQPETPTPCETHDDADQNGVCDVCQATVPVEPAPCQTHTDKNNDKICDVCKKKIPADKIAYTITLTDESGAPMAGIEISLNQEGEPVATATTDEAGQIKGELEAGSYQLILGELPEYWYSGANYSTVALSKDNNSFTLVALDNSPNGSVEKPFPAENAETGVAACVTFAAGESFYFTTKGASRYLVIENANAKVLYKDSEYLPEDGVIRILLDASDVNASTLFRVVNTAEGENAIQLGFEALPGTLGNPYAAQIGTVHTVTVYAGSSVYYKVTVAQSGVLRLSSLAETNNIILYNTTTSVVSAATEGNTEVSLDVSAGDEILITVSTLLQEPSDESLPVPSDEIDFMLIIEEDSE